MSRGHPVTIQARRTYGGASEEERRTRRRAALLMPPGRRRRQRRQRPGVKAVCNAAGLNDRYFYQQFGDCDEALMALYDDLIVEGTARSCWRSTRPNRGPTPDCGHAWPPRSTSSPSIRVAAGFLIESQATEALRAKRQELVSALAGVMLSSRPPPGADAPSEDYSRLMALTIRERRPDLGAMWLRGDLDIQRGCPDRLHDDLHHVGDLVMAPAG